MERFSHDLTEVPDCNVREIAVDARFGRIAKFANVSKRSPDSAGSGSLPELDPPPLISVGQRI